MATTNELLILVRVDGQDALRTIRVTGEEIRGLAQQATQSAEAGEQLATSLQLPAELRQELEQVRGQMEALGASAGEQGAKGAAALEQQATALRTLSSAAQEAGQQVRGLASGGEEVARSQAELRAELQRVTDQLRGATNAYRTALQGGGDVQAAQTRLQQLQAEQEALRARIEALRESRTAAVQTQSATENLAVAEAELSLELRSVLEHLNQLRRAYLDPANEKRRTEIVSETAAYEEQRKAILGQIDALRRQRDEQEGVAQASGQASSFVTQLSYAFSDLGYVVQHPTQAINVLGGNLTYLGSQLAGMQKAARESGTTVRQQLLTAFTGPVGFIGVATAAGAAASLLLPLLNNLFSGSAEEAKKAQKEYQDALDAAVRYELGAPSVVITDPETARAQQRALESQKRALEETIQAAAQLSGYYQTLSDTVSPFSAAADEAGEKLAEQKRAILEARTALADVEGELEQVTDALKQFERQTELAMAAVRRGEGTLADFFPELRRLQDRVTETEREIADTRRQIAGESEEAILRSRLRSIELQLEAGNSLVVQDRQTAEERLQLELEASQIRLQLTRQELREREQARQEALQSALQRTRQLEQLVGDLRIEIITDTRRRELAEAERTFQERMRLAEGHTEAEILARVAYVQRVVEVNREAEETMRQEQARTRRQEQELAEVRAQLAGATERAVLRQRMAFLDEEIGRYEEGTDTYRELTLERARAELQLTQITEREAERRRQAHEREMQRVRQNAEREYQAIVASVERYTSQVIDALDETFRHERRYSDAEIALQRDRFREEEEQLLESLNKREISQREYDLRMRKLAEDRAAFQKAVDEDHASFSERLLHNLADIAIEAGERALAAWIAQKAVEMAIGTQQQFAATAVATATGKAIEAAYANAAALASIATFGTSAVAGATAFTAAMATMRGVIAASNLIAFETGGFVGTRGEAGRDEVHAVLGRGEAVLNRHQQRYVEAALRSTYGFGLGELFDRERRPHYLATGGFVAFQPTRATVSAGTPGTGGGADPSLMLAELRAIRSEQEATRRRIGELDDNQQRALDAQATRLGRVVADPHAARRQRILAARQDRVINPRGGVL